MVITMHAGNAHRILSRLVCEKAGQRQNENKHEK